MNDKFRKRINNQIELTSLLDVIFIVLMIVICNQQINMTAKTEEIAVERQAVEAELAEAKYLKAEAEDMKAEAEAEKKLYEESRKIHEDMQNQLGVIVVYADYTPSDPGRRELLVLADGNEAVKIELNSGNERSAFKKLEEILDNEISKASKTGKPVVISVNRDRILFRDEKTITEITDRLFRKHDNLYYRQEAEK